MASVDVRGEPFELRPHPAGLAKPALAGMIALPQFRLQPLGAIAQLGERLHGMQEVVGSSPISSTLKARRPEGRRAFLCSLFFWKIQPSYAAG